MNIFLGVSGGIAAYKAVDFVSKCRKQGWNVRVAMTRSATRFVGPLTFEGMSGHPVMVDALADGAGAGEASSIDHIDWAKWADVAVIAPATANIMGKLACGLADDAVTTVLMAIPASVPRILAPAMNTAMWENPVVQRNRSWLQDLGFHEVEPIVKRLACGDVGQGALADTQEIVDAVKEIAGA